MSWAFGELKAWFKKEQKKKKSRVIVDQQRDKLKKELDKGFDGEKLTDKQIKGIVDAARDLATDY